MTWRNRCAIDSLLCILLKKIGKFTRFVYFRIYTYYLPTNIFSLHFEDIFIILLLIKTTNLMASAMSIEMSTVCIFLVINFWLSRGIVLVTITSSMSESCNKNGELSDKLSNNQSEKVTLHKRYHVIITPSKFFCGLLK